MNITTESIKNPINRNFVVGHITFDDNAQARKILALLKELKPTDGFCLIGNTVIFSETQSTLMFGEINPTEPERVMEALIYYSIRYCDVDIIHTDAFKNVDNDKHEIADSIIEYKIEVGKTDKSDIDGIETVCNTATYKYGDKDGGSRISVGRCYEKVDDGKPDIEKDVSSEKPAENTCEKPNGVFEDGGKNREAEESEELSLKIDNLIRANEKISAELENTRNELNEARRQLELEKERLSEVQKDEKTAYEADSRVQACANPVKETPQTAEFGASGNNSVNPESKPEDTDGIQSGINNSDIAGVLSLLIETLNQNKKEAAETESSKESPATDNTAGQDQTVPLQVKPDTKEDRTDDSFSLNKKNEQVSLEKETYPAETAKENPSSEANLQNTDKSFSTDDATKEIKSETAQSVRTESAEQTPSSVSETIKEASAIAADIINNNVDSPALAADEISNTSADIPVTEKQPVKTDEAAVEKEPVLSFEEIHTQWETECKEIKARQKDYVDSLLDDVLKDLLSEPGKKHDEALAACNEKLAELSNTKADAEDEMSRLKAFNVLKKKNLKETAEKAAEDIKFYEAMKNKANTEYAIATEKALQEINVKRHEYESIAVEAFPLPPEPVKA